MGAIATAVGRLMNVLCICKGGDVRIAIGDMLMVSIQICSLRTLYVDVSCLILFQFECCTKNIIERSSGESKFASNMIIVLSDKISNYMKHSSNIGSGISNIALHNIQSPVTHKFNKVKMFKSQQSNGSCSLHRTYL